MIYTILRFISLVLCKFFFSLKIIGRGNLPKKTGYIVASNHTSFLDPIIIGVGVTVKLKFIAKESLFKNPLFSWLLKQLGTFPIKRGYNDFGAIKKAIKFLKNGHATVMFPQGARGDEEIIEAKAGVALLAQSASVPVVPAYIKGAAQAWGKHDKVIKPCNISVKFGKPIYFNKGLSREKIVNLVIEGINNLQ